MKSLSTIAACFTTALALASPCLAAAADKAAEQAEIKKATQSAIEKLYKEKPSIKGEVQAAPGYAVFTTYGVTLLVGGSGGHGLAHDAANKKDVFMHMAQASAGIEAGISQKEMLIVFKSRKALQNFVDKGWEFGGQGNLSAGAAGHTAGGGSGVQEISDATTYTFTKNGLAVGVGLAGTKFWKDKDLN